MSVSPSANARRNRGLSGLAMALCLGSGVALAGAATPAAAADTVTFDFTGVCSDCTGMGVGELTLQNFTPGQKLTAANFVSFTYNSNFVSMSLNAGQLTALDAILDPANLTANHVMISGGGQTFESTGTGFWAVSTGAGGGGGGDPGVGLPAPFDGGVGFFEGAGFESINIGSVVEDVGTDGGFRQDSAVPEPASWALMIFGFGGAGAALRGRKQRMTRLDVA
jgi:hypothetical protein